MDRRVNLKLTPEGRGRLGRLRDWFESRSLTDAVERTLRLADVIRGHVASGGRIVFVGPDGAHVEVKL